MVDDDRAKARARVEAERKKVRDAEAEKALRKMASEGLEDLETKKGLSGCATGIVAILVAVGVAGALIALLTHDSGSTKTSAGAPAPSSSCAESGARADHLHLIACDKPAGLDGHW